MLDVVVFPCVPVTAIVGRRRVSSPSRSARCSSRSPRSRAAARSGFSGGIALETTTSAPSGTFAAAWPTAGSIPAARSGAGVRRAGRAVRARHARAERVGDEREAAHPGPADADEVQPASCPLGAHGRAA